MKLGADKNIDRLARNSPSLADQSVSLFHPSGTISIVSVKRRECDINIGIYCRKIFIIKLPITKTTRWGVNRAPITAQGKNAFVTDWAFSCSCLKLACDRS